MSSKHLYTVLVIIRGCAVQHVCVKKVFITIFMCIYIQIYREEA